MQSESSDSEKWCNLGDLVCVPDDFRGELFSAIPPPYIYYSESRYYKIKSIQNIQIIKKLQMHLDAIGNVSQEKQTIEVHACIRRPA